MSASPTATAIRCSTDICTCDIYTCSRMYVYIRVYVYVCVCVCVYIYIYIHTHTLRHTCTYMDTEKDAFLTNVSPEHTYLTGAAVTGGCHTRIHLCSPPSGIRCALAARGGAAAVVRRLSASPGILRGSFGLEGKTDTRQRRRTGERGVEGNTSDNRCTDVLGRG